jgi:hypothetical protein
MARLHSFRKYVKGARMAVCLGFALLLLATALAESPPPFSTSKLAAGKHSFTTTYDGSTDFTGSTSPVLTQTVN